MFLLGMVKVELVLGQPTSPPNKLILVETCIMGGLRHIIMSAHHCSKKLHLQSYLDMLCSKTGYFGILGNKHI